MISSALLNFDAIQAQLFDFVKQKYEFIVTVQDHNATSDAEMSTLRDGRLIINPNTYVPGASIFVCAHVFGHMVQLSLSNKYDGLVDTIEEQAPPVRLDRSILRAYWFFELEAYRIGLGLLDAAIGEDNRLKLSYVTYMRADMKYYFAYLRTGETIEKKDFARLYLRKLEDAYSCAEVAERLVPLPIPDEPFIDRSLSIDVV